MEITSQTTAASALGGTGSWVPSRYAALGGTGGWVPSRYAALGGTGGWVPSRYAALGGTGGCVPSSMAAKLLCDGALHGVTLATRPQTTNNNTTALAVRFIGVSCFSSWRV